MSLKNKHIINTRQALLSALKVINTLMPDPLVLFVVDDEDKMVGTLTDGDSRRALIAGISVNDSIEKVITWVQDFIQEYLAKVLSPILKIQADILMLTGKLLALQDKITQKIQSIPVCRIDFTPDLDQLSE